MLTVIPCPRGWDFIDNDDLILLKLPDVIADS